MAEAIKGKHGVDATLIEGGGGVFDVHIDENQVWCKKDVGRFPENQEILDKIAALTT